MKTRYFAQNTIAILIDSFEAVHRLPNPMMMNEDESISSQSAGHSSSKDFSSSTEDISTSNASTAFRRDTRQEVGANETRAVKRSKWIVLAVLVISATVAGALTYFFTKRAETEAFERQVSNVFRME